jgi:hypothetical protein
VCVAIATAEDDRLEAAAPCRSPQL